MTCLLAFFLSGLLIAAPKDTNAHTTPIALTVTLTEEQDAQRMLAFCSNAGPSFLIGILSTKFSEGWILWLIWGIHNLSAVAVAMIFGDNEEFLNMIKKYQNKNTNNTVQTQTK